MLKIRKKLAEKKEASKGIAKAGFTLIELLVVIAILAILVLLAAPRFLGYTKDANVSTMQADAKVLTNASLIHNIENEDWPVVVDEETGEIVTATLEIDGAEVTYAAFNEDAIKSHVQTLKGDLTDYALVTADALIGEDKLQEGDVVFIGKGGEGVEDREGDKHYSVNVEVEADSEVAEEDLGEEGA